MPAANRNVIGLMVSGFAVLAACTPNAPEPEATGPKSMNEQTIPGEAPLAPAAAATPSAATPDNLEQPAPGFAGVWAMDDKDCATPAKTFKLSAQEINMTPGERACAVKSVSSETPTGRSMIYTVQAACLTEGVESQDTFKMTFGASDTALKLQLNDRDPVTLMRCP